MRRAGAREQGTGNRGSAEVARSLASSLARIAAALAPFTHRTLSSWRRAKQRIAVLDSIELIQAVEFERLGKRRTEHLKLLDIEIRRRAGDAEDRRFVVEAGKKGVGSRQIGTEEPEGGWK